MANWRGGPISSLGGRHRVRLALRRLGIDVSRYPSQSPDYAAMRSFLETYPDLILDVGAHVGAFVRECRARGFDGSAVSFEPARGAYWQLKAAATGDSRWRTVRAAVGEYNGESVLNIAGNAGASSSLLRMLDRHVEALPASAYLGSERVPVLRLDDWLECNAPDSPRIGLKLDVQGYERQALLGMGNRLDDVVAMRVELSVQPLYGGSWTWLEAGQWICDRGFVLCGLIPGFQDQQTGELLQFDAVFGRA